MQEHYEYLETEPNLRFFEILRKFSTNPYDPVPEWELDTTKFIATKSRCICTTPIERNFYIRHKQSGKELVIGSECVKRWINPRLVCKTCDSPLGRVDKRIETQDFLCPKCKREAKKKLRDEAQEKAKKIQQLSLYRLYFGGKYYGRFFRDVIDDIPYVEFLLNLSFETVPKTLKLFYVYVSCVYDIQEQTVDEN